MHLPFKLVYSNDYYLPLGAHVFPAQKYRLIYQRLLESEIAAEDDFLEPQPAPDEDIRLVHTPEYVHKLQTGTLSVSEQMQMEVPYSPELVRAFWLAAGGSTLAARRAVKDGCCVNVGGGFHHAHPDHGEGFCVVHDVAVAIRRLQKDGAITTAMVIDCDVHHGNGTAAIFPPKGESSPAGPPSRPYLQAQWGVSSEDPLASFVTTSEPDKVFTLSVHQYNNYPAWKPPSSYDLNLRDRVEDNEYLELLVRALDWALSRFTPDLLCYVAGADPYKEDQLGGLALTIDGLKQRDLLVLSRAKEKNIPVMITYAGGYARRVEDTVMIHTNTVLAAQEVFN